MSETTANIGVAGYAPALYGIESEETRACRVANEKAMAEFNVAMQRRAGVSSPEPETRNLTPAPVILDEHTAVSIYLAARKRTEQVQRWFDDAAENFTRIEAKVDSYGTLKDEIRESRQASIKMGKRPTTPPAKRAAIQALSEAEQELSLARDERHDFQQQLTNAKQEESRCYVVARNSVGVSLGDAAVRPLVKRYLEAFDALESLKLKLETIPNGIGDTALASVLNNALRREQVPPNDIQTNAARQDWQSLLQDRLERLLKQD